jgi:hypothetical protein
VTLPDTTLSATKVPGAPGQPANAVLTWFGPWILQTSTGVAGPWSNVTGATSPYSVPGRPTAIFYRLVLPP